MVRYLQRSARGCGWGVAELARAPLGFDSRPDHANVVSALRSATFRPSRSSFSLDQGTHLSFTQPVYLVTGPRSDLTLYGGLFEGRNPVGRSELRWARSPQDFNSIDVKGVGQSMRAVSAIAERWGHLHLSLTGEALSTSKHRRRFVNAWQDRQISDTALNGRLGIHGDTATVDLSGEWAQTTRGDSTSPSLGWGKGHLTWAPNLPGVAPRVDGRALYGGSHRGERFGQMDLGGELATQLWLGALAFRPYVGGGWIRQLASDATASSYVIGYESRIDWQRAHRSTHHRAGLILDGNWGQGYGQTEDI